MPRFGTRLTRAVPSLAVAATLAFGAHAAFASPTKGPCSPGPSGSGWIGLSCTVGPAGDAYCDSMCKEEYNPGVFGQCTFHGCCLCGL